jgi:hypothetical protein
LGYDNHLEDLLRVSDTAFTDTPIDKVLPLGTSAREWVKQNTHRIGRCARPLDATTSSGDASSPDVDFWVERVRDGQRSGARVRSLRELRKLSSIGRSRRIWRAGLARTAGSAFHLASLGAPSTGSDYFWPRHGNGLALGGEPTVAPLGARLSCNRRSDSPKFSIGSEPWLRALQRERLKRSYTCRFGDIQHSLSAWMLLLLRPCMPIRHDQ